MHNMEWIADYRLKCNSSIVHVSYVFFPHSLSIRLIENKSQVISRFNYLILINFFLYCLKIFNQQETKLPQARYQACVVAFLVGNEIT